MIAKLFRSVSMLCTLAIVAFCGPLRADPLERVEATRADCPEYLAPAKFVEYDSAGQRDPCYLGEIKALLAYLEATKDQEEIGDIHSRLIELYAAVGDENASQRIVRLYAAVGDATRSSNDRYAVTGAVSYIARRAADHQLVILNENHAQPRNRNFARQLLRPLREQGYRYFAAEAFESNPEVFSRSLASGSPTFATGPYYVRDPSFGRLIREAMALGFELVPYEAFEPVNGPAPKEPFEYHVYRETSQAKNLYARVFAKDPGAKLFVYVGFSHVIEDPVQRTLGPGMAKWMAAELKALSGKDPLTIDQVSLTPAPDAKLDDEDYGLVAPLLRGATPQVVLKGNAPADIGFYGNKVDITVAHPRLDDVQGRPGWVLQDSRFRHVVAMAPSRGLMQLRLQGEAADAIPFDQMLVEQSGSVVLLAPRHDNVKAVFIPWN